MQVWFDIQKYITAITTLTNNRRIKSHDHITWCRVLSPRMTKILRKLGKEGNIINLLRIYKNPTANITLNRKKQGIFLQRAKIRQSYLPLPYLFNIVLEVPASPIRQEKETKTTYHSERGKYNHFMVHIENPKESKK